MSYGFLHAILNGIAWDKIAEITGYNSDHIRKEVTAYLRGDKEKLPEKMTAALQRTLPILHNEIPLHTYTVDLFEGIFELRQREDQARALFKKVDPLTVGRVQQLWKEAKAHIFGAYISRTVVHALRLLREDSETLEEDERTTVYLGAAVLHTLLIVWDDAANAMKDAVPGDDEDRDLDFVDLHLAAVSVIDLAETTLRLYQQVEAEHLRLLRNQRSVIDGIKNSLTEIKINEERGTREAEIRELQSRLLRAESLLSNVEQDRAIANMNMASVSSFAEDWNNPDNKYLALLDVPAEEARMRLVRISGFCGATMLQAVPLMKRYRRNQLVARNLAYMALQYDAKKVLEAAAEHLAVELGGIAQSEVWSSSIAHRKPLTAEKAIADKFENGQPIILQTSGEA
ncbi:hypothetical protein [Rhizobium sp. BK068]|uniref:hypothetical protein n=1 Tax=Rhizobium sp. BK068 TaxID=2512130 RepID=UPI0010493BE6|nr:hypothetical protein [Rhizobium sp. BK068]TCM65733.1 hypothetical protein EV291_14211 [Rhizobium sp. BK068]